MKRSSSFLLFIFGFLICGFGIVFLVGKGMKRGEMEKRQLSLENECKSVAANFEKGVEKYALVVAGIRSFILNNKKIPSPQELHNYLAVQLNDTQYQGSLVVSFIDTNHVFQYSVSRDSINPNELSGSSVKDFRSEEEVERLNLLMETDRMTLFPPINLVEGWVGIPLNFRVVLDGELKGYFAPLINFQTIIEEVYESANSNDFVYRFSTEDGVKFDRTAIYDGSKIYNSKADPESFKNFELEDKEFVFSSFEIFQREFMVGVAKKEPAFYLGSNQSQLLISWYCIIVISALMFFLYWYLQRKKNQELQIKNKKLQVYNEALEKFTYASSHDLKEPLRTIGSFSTLLKRRFSTKLNEEGIQYIDFIVHGVERMNHLLNSLLKYSRIIHNKELPKSKVSIGGIVNNVLHSLGATIDEKKVEIKVDPDLPTLHSSEVHMQQLFQNLISNAIKFNSDQSPFVKIGCQKQDGAYLFSIADNGMGIESSYHEKIFEPFQRLHKNDFEGSGIGLSICKKIIEQNNGSIWVDSKEGKGTVFYFTLADSLN